MFDKIVKLLKIRFASSLTLKDGTPLELNGDLDTGVQVSVVTSDGNVPLPDGEYQLEDMTILMVKDGLVTDIIKPGDVETEDKESLDAPTETSSDELATQKENPEVSGDDPKKPLEKGMPETTGTTEATAPEVKAEDMPIDPTEDPMMDPEEIDPKDLIIKELVDKVANMDQAIADIMAKTEYDFGKSSQPQLLSIRKKEDNGSTIDPKLQGKVDIIKKLKSGNRNFLD